MMSEVQAERIDQPQNSPITSLDEAIGKIVLCTDGLTRRLRSYDERLGYYSVPISDEVWMDLSGTRIRDCREMFIGGIAVEDASPID